MAATRIDTRCGQRGGKTERQRRHHGYQRRERQDSNVDGQVQRQGHRGWELYCCEKACRPVRDGDAADSAGTRQQQALCQQLTQQPPTPGAECLSDCELQAATGRACQDQVRQIDADDEQNKTDDRHEDRCERRNRRRDLGMKGGA